MNSEQKSETETEVPTELEACRQLLALEQKKVLELEAENLE
jgi:hypothetical protein